MHMLVRSFGVDIAVRKTTDRRIVQNYPRKVPLVMMTVHPHIKEYHFSQVIPVLIMTVTKMVEFFLATGVIDLAAVTKVDRSELSLLVKTLKMITQMSISVINYLFVVSSFFSIAIFITALPLFILCIVSIFIYSHNYKLLSLTSVTVVESTMYYRITYLEVIIIIIYN
jgi:hypothetical protein